MWSRSDTPTAVAAVAIVGVLLTWAVRDGGYAPTRWLAGALFLLGLLVVLLLSSPVERLSKCAIGSIVLLAAFTAWSALSIAWAGVKADAWDGANRTLLYLVVYVLFVTRAWRPFLAGAALGTWALGVAVIGVIDLVRAAQAGAAPHFFVAGRLAVPIAYPNATTALFLMAIWVTLFLASRRETPVLVRGLMFAAMGALAELALMGQSRASLFAMPIVGVFYVALVPGRARALVVVVPVALAVWLSGPTLLDVYTAVTSGKDIAGALVEARWTVAASAAALFALGVVVGLLDAALTLPEHVARAARRAAGIAALAATLASVGALVVAFGDPVARAEQGWREFKSNANTPQTKLHIVSGLGSKRYDLWRVAVLEFERTPVTGIGVDNYAVQYLKQRRTTEEPLYPHSLLLRLPLQTGIVGTFLFTGFLAFALVDGFRSVRIGSELSRGLAGAALVSFAYWFTHGAVDWLWEMPALGGAAFAWLALSTRGCSPAPGNSAASGVGLPRRLVPVLAAVAIPAAASFALPWIAAREVEAAAAGWRSHPQKAYDRLELARRLNPLSAKPDLVASVIAARAHDNARQRRALERALRRDSSNWYAYLQLGMLDSIEGRRASAEAELARAVELNPRDPVVLDVARRVEEGRRVDRAEVERLFAQRVELLTGQRQR